MKDSIINKKMEHNITINNFEGPLDVLLYLICKNKMNIFEISLNDLTDEYIAYLNEMSELNIEIATEFVVMASLLIEIKSRKLLPKEEKEDEETISEEELMARLIQYKKYKELSVYILERYKENFGSFEKKPEKIKFEKQNEYTGEMFDLEKLKDIYLSAITRNRNKMNIKAKEIEKIALYERITVKDKTNQIVNYLKNNESFIFNNMFNVSKNDKIEVVTAFLGTLELSKEKQVTLEQQSLFSDIYVKRNECIQTYQF
ncbi:MAG: segregation/condensation protein A [Clostridia bacterium]|nr:segregation/condensation protein A [Clostridia bacterium]